MSVPPDKLEWVEWTGTEDVPIVTLLLMEVEGHNRYQTGIFTKNGKTIFGVVGGCFHFDHNLIAYAKIQHLVEGR